MCVSSVYSLTAARRQVVCASLSCLLARHVPEVWLVHSPGCLSRLVGWSPGYVLAHSPALRSEPSGKEAPQKVAILFQLCLSRLGEAVPRQAA
jgi:hypothetical protein